VKAFPAFHIVGNLYYVGTYDLASFLVVTSDGNILINTGVDGSVPMICANIESLGFNFADIKILLAMHAHWDHVGGMAEAKRVTGATTMMHDADADVLEDGGDSDYRFPRGQGQVFEPVKVDRRLKEGDTIRLGNTQLAVYHHPGHTKGATSFAFTTEEGGRDYRVLVASIGSINEGVKLLDTPRYPNIVQDYARTFESQKRFFRTFDVWVSAHARAFRLHEKYKNGDQHDPNRFVDTAGYASMVRRLEQVYLDQLERELSGK
jgi:metallo-beta-lactamase class B